MGICPVVRPTDRARRRRNASDEFPSEKSATIAEVEDEGAVEDGAGRRRTGRRVGRGAAGRRRGGSRTRATSAVAIAPGMTATQKTVRIGQPHRDEQRREQRPDDGARVVHRLVEAEGAARPVAGRVGDERVARRAAEALSDAVGHAHGEHVPGARRESHEGPRRAGEPVAEEDERLAPAPSGRR